MTSLFVYIHIFTLTTYRDSNGPGNRGRAQWLKACTTLAEGQSSIPCTHIRLTIVYNFNSRGSHSSLAFTGTYTHVCHTHTYTLFSKTMDHKNKLQVYCINHYNTFKPVDILSPSLLSLFQWSWLKPAFSTVSTQPYFNKPAFHIGNKLKTKNTCLLKNPSIHSHSQTNQAIDTIMMAMYTLERCQPWLSCPGDTELS